MLGKRLQKMKRKIAKQQIQMKMEDSIMLWKMDQEILCLLRFQDIKEKIAKDRKVIPDPIDDRKFQE